MKKRIAVGFTLLALSSPSMAQQCVASTPIQPTIAPGKCKPGFVLQYGVFGEECYEKSSRDDDIFASKNGISFNRDGDGNITSVYRFDPTTGANYRKVADFGDFDKFGRPGRYFEEYLGATVTEVKLEWPADGGCLPSAMITQGWRSALTWIDPEHLAAIDTPLKDRKAVYSFMYYPDGNLHIASTAIAMPDSRLSLVHAYSEAGDQIGYTANSIAYPRAAPPVASAAVAPNSSAAVAPPNRSAAAAAPAPDPFFQPKVVVARPVPGGPLGVRLLGPLTLLYPSFDYLGKQIGRFYLNAMASGNQELDDKCAAQLRGHYEACKKFWSDKGFDPDNLPTEDFKAAHIKCGASARALHKQCMAGLNPGELDLPWAGDVGNQANINCYKDYATDKEACRVAAVAKYARLGYYPTLYQVDLYGCILSADRRLAQCKAGQKLSDLDLPK